MKIKNMVVFLEILIFIVILAISPLAALLIPCIILVIFTAWKLFVDRDDDYESQARKRYYRTQKINELYPQAHFDSTNSYTDRKSWIDVVLNETADMTDEDFEQYLKDKLESKGTNNNEF